MPNIGKICRFLSCPSRSNLHPGKRFHPFAKPWMDREKCLRWILASGRKDITTDDINKHYYVCEDHFVNGSPSAENPDPLPHISVVCKSVFVGYSLTKRTVIVLLCFRSGVIIFLIMTKTSFSMTLSLRLVLIIHLNFIHKKTLVMLKLPPHLQERLLLSYLTMFRFVDINENTQWLSYF